MVVKRLRRPLSLLICLAFLWTQVAVAALACDPSDAHAAAQSTAAPCHGEPAATPGRSALPAALPSAAATAGHGQAAGQFAPLGGSPHAGVLVLCLDAGGQRAQPASRDAAACVAAAASISTRTA